MTATNQNQTSPRYQKTKALSVQAYRLFEDGKALSEIGKIQSASSSVVSHRVDRGHEILFKEGKL